MARRAQPLGRLAAAGAILAAAIPLLVLGTGAAVLWQAEAGRGFSGADWAAIRFTLVQAALSAVISVLLAIPVARALARREFMGRGFLITLLGAPFLLPVIVAIFGLLTVFGRSGWVNDLAALVGLPPISIYGLWGVVLAHVFFNLPLATRLFLQGWQDIPPERFRLAATLGMSASAVNRHLEWPMLRNVLPGALLVIFVICTTSFAVALTLGGGPRATTVELAIYQALRFEFDLSRAALLSLVQLGITGTAALLALRYATHVGFGAGRGLLPRRWDGAAMRHRVADGGIIALASLFLVLPMLALVLRGLAEVPGLPASVWESLWHSIVVAFGSTVMVVGAAVPISLAIVRGGMRARAADVAVLTAIAASPLVLGTGLFVLTFPFIAPERLALPVTALINAVVTIPFAVRALVPPMRAVESDFGPLSDALGLSAAARLRLVILPRLRRPLGFSAGLAAALSMGDLGVIALFADPERATLPLQIYRLMGAYRMEAAAGASVVLLIASFGVFWMFDAWGRRDAQS